MEMDRTDRINETKVTFSVKEEGMSRGNLLSAALAALMLAGLASGCINEQEPRSYVQANVVDKAYFSGEWWYTNRIIDVSVETDQWGFPGEAAYNFSNPELYAVERIRWVIDEDYLYAFRTYELVEGSNPDGDDPDYIGEPVVAYAIDSHFDIRRSYNPTTGEEYNIVEENTQDRRWYERRFMRVDWSQLTMTPLLTNLNLFEGYMGGILTREQAPLYVQEGTNQETDFPLSYRPMFHRASEEFDAIHGTQLCDDPATPEREGDYDEGELYFMSFVTREVISPGNVPDPFTGQPVNFCLSVYMNAPYCSSNTMTIRHSFLKISEHHDFAPLDYQEHTRQNHFGAFQTARWIYDGGDPEDPSDPRYGDTQYWHKNAVMFNIWQRYHDEDGNLLPYSEREPRRTVWVTSPEMPRWLLRPSHAIFAEWNEVYANMFRSVRGEPLPDRDHNNPRDWFTPPDPALNDIDCYIGDIGGGPAAEDPLPQYDSLDPPDEDYVYPEVSGFEAFKDENRLAFIGDECWFSIRVNSCDAPLDAFPDTVQARIQDYMDSVGKTSIEQVTDDELFGLGVQCEGRGDMRWNLLSYVDLPAPNVGWLGIATMQGDPITGETIIGDANIGAAALHGYRKRAMEEYDLITGNISEYAFETGEDIRSYMDNLGMTMRPSVPARDMIQAGLSTEYGTDLTGIREHMDHIMDTKARYLRADSYMDIASQRLSSMKGTSYERMLLDNDDAMAMAGFENQGTDPGVRPVDAILEVASPFRADFGSKASRLSALQEYYSLHNVIMPNSFIDYSVAKWAEDHKGMPRKNLVFEIEQKLFKDTLIHEMGHVLNLRHNMRGTADPWNYPGKFYDIAEAHPMPDPTSFDVDGDGSLDAVEARAYKVEYNDVRKDRELDGIDTWMTTSMMDYTANWYQRYMPEGFLVMPYDEAAIMFSYGDQVEVWDNSALRQNRCHDPANGDTTNCVHEGNTPRVWWTYYGGGEACSTDADCPYGQGGELFDELKDAQIEAGLVQRCGKNTYSGDGMCTNYFEDWQDYYAGQSDPDATRWVGRKYKYCDDYNRPDIGGNDSQCYVFDGGASYREMVENWRESYLRKYLFTYFRRYRATFDYSSVMGAWSRYIFEPMVIFNDMIYRYSTEGEEYRNDTGPFGFYDQYLACVDLLNFWMEMIGIPDIGSYEFDPYENEYRRMSPYTDHASSDLSIKTGLGRHVYTSYQTGLNGIYRLEYVGTVYDKIYALEAMLQRGGAANYSNDDYFFLNFYDVFPDEVRYILRGIVSEEPRFYAPRVASVDPDSRLPVLQYVDFYRGNCTIESPDDVPGYDECRPPAHELYSGMPVLNDEKSFMLQNYGLIFGLSYMPTYFDTSPQEMLHFYKVGSLDDARIDPSLVEGEDYVTYTSDITHQTFLAFQMDDTPGKVGGSIAFGVVSKLNEIQDNLEMWVDCRDDGDDGTNCEFANASDLADAIQKARYDKTNFESLVNYAIEIQHQYGINSYMGYEPSM
jgi:hypothetical protein